MSKGWHLVAIYCHYTKLYSQSNYLRTRWLSTCATQPLTYCIACFRSSSLWPCGVLSKSFLHVCGWTGDASVLETSRSLHSHNICSELPPSVALCRLAIKSRCCFLLPLWIFEVVRPLPAAAAQQSQQGRRAQAHNPARRRALQMQANAAQRTAASFGGRVVQQRVLGASLRHHCQLCQGSGGRQQT